MTSRLQRLASYGPLAAYVSAASVPLFFLTQRFGSAIAAASPGLYAPLVIVTFVAFFVWAAGLAVVGLDLARLYHLGTNMRWLPIARGAALVALVVQVPLDIGLVVNAGVPVQAPSYLLIYGGVGISLLLYNLGARRAGTLHGALPWLGSVTGAAYVLAGIGFGAFPIPGLGMTFYLVGFNVLQLGQALYVAWAVWMGVKLSRSKAASTVPAVMAGAR